MSTIKDFLNKESDAILGQLLANDEFKTEDLQKNAWKEEIKILKDQLQGFETGGICLEYSIPRLGHRIDVVCIISGIIFLLEFKVGDKKFQRKATDQVLDYALDLKYFHEESKDRYIVPINVSTNASTPQINVFEFSDDKISSVLKCNKNTISEAIQQVLSVTIDNPLGIEKWSASRYSPTPTIIEAAQALYHNHSVEEISRNDAGAKNLTLTTDAINRIIDSCKSEHKKAICFITGVPGAGKTLAGLNIVSNRQEFETDEHAVLLSGNGPLVDVLQAALVKDKASRDHTSKTEAKRQVKAFIQKIHNFRDDAISNDGLPPVEKVAVFDEAQRAWDRDKLSSFMRNKTGVSDFNQSEPEFLISVMDRHEDWAVIICLVGGGQEIYSGEAGIEEWFKTLNNKYFNWDIYLSDQMKDAEYVGNTTISDLLNARKYNIEPNLHLDVSLRSFRSENLAAFIKAILDNKPAQATELYSKLSPSYPIVMTRDLEEAKRWVKTKARGDERYGLLASSEGKRLRSVGVWVLTDINYVGWFLNDKDNVDSSYYLELAASEFKVQGLELDYALVAWDADFRYVSGNFDYFRYRGTRWEHINKIQRQRYLKNAYRVLLTRSRQGFVIFIPEGDPMDDSRKPEYYDGTYKYLQQIGIQEINDKN